MKVAVSIALFTIPASTGSSARVDDLVVTGSGLMTADPVRARSGARRAGELRRGVGERRRATWAHEDELELERTPTAYREFETRALAYLRWLRQRWAERADRRWRLRVGLRDPRAAIRFVFGPYAGAALAVSSCETGGTFDTKAANGQYLGLFQMGAGERERYGHGPSALEQARAALRYFIASGRDWSPWSCQP